MKYFKLIDNNLIIGVITSDNFMHYDILTDTYVRVNEQIGEYAGYNGKFYRDEWMKPFIHQASYEEVTIMEIDKQEYDILFEALKIEPTIIYVDENQGIDNDPTEPVDNTSLDFIRSSKLKEMSYACRTTIEAGFDLDIHDEKQHFSLTTQDQLNLMSLGAMAQTQSLIPYHADGEQTTFYTGEEINEIVEAANSFKIYHTTYYNALKDYINSLETIEEISAITYGVEIPEEYKSNVLKILEE